MDRIKIKDEKKEQKKRNIWVKVILIHKIDQNDSQMAGFISYTNAKRRPCHANYKYLQTIFIFVDKFISIIYCRFTDSDLNSYNGIM